MGRIFDVNNRVWTSIVKLGETGFVSICAILLSLPILTCFSSWIALYYTVVKAVRRERSYVWKEYFRSFRDNLKQGVAITLLSVLYLTITYLWYNMSCQQPDGSMSGRACFIISSSLVVLYVAVIVWLIPVISRFQCNVLEGIKISLFLAIRHLGETILMIVIAVTLLECVMILHVLVVIAPGAYMFLASFFVERILKKYMKIEPEENADLWFME